MTKSKNSARLLSLLREKYPKEQIFLQHKNILELLIATILSAQCTDARVNIVTKSLFKKYRTLDDYCNANPAEFQNDIRSTGFFRNKTKNILAACQKIKSGFKGIVPATMEELVTLPGVARKTANIVLSQGFNVHSGIAVDTHVQRVSQRLGLAHQTNPVKIEQELMTLVPTSDYWWLSTSLISLGRAYCQARKPNCKGCFLNKQCPSAFKIHSSLAVIKKSTAT